MLDGGDPAWGVTEATASQRDLPGGLVRVRLRLHPFDSVKNNALPMGARSEDGWPLTPSALRDRALLEAGWNAVDGTRSVDVDPLDPASVATVVDALQAAIDACVAASGVPAGPWFRWQVQATHPQTIGLPVPPDERWVEDATELDLRERLVRLAGLRGGWVAVRPTTGVDVELELSARRRRGRIEVRARDPASSWRGAWSMHADAPRADAIVRDLSAALAGFAPDGPAPGLCVRLEAHDEAEAWEQTSAYLFIFGWLVAIAVVVGATLAIRPAGAAVWLAIIDRALADLEHEWAPIIVIGLTSVLPAIVGGAAAAGMCGRLGLGYNASAWVTVAGAAAACVAYLVVLVVAGSSWGLVVAATWIAVTAALVGPGIARHARRAGGARNA